MAKQQHYSYQTYPGQVIVRPVDDGYTLDELLVELHNNGEGVILYDDRRDGETVPEEFVPYIERTCDSL